MDLKMFMPSFMATFTFPTFHVVILWFRNVVKTLKKNPLTLEFNGDKQYINVLWHMTQERGREKVGAVNYNPKSSAGLTFDNVSIAARLGSGLNKQEGVTCDKY